MQSPPNTEGGRRKDVAEGCAQIVHESDAGLVFVLENKSSKDIRFKYDFTGSTNLSLTPGEKATKAGELIVECGVPPSSAVNLCHLKVVNSGAGFELRSKLQTMTGGSTGFKSQDERGDETKKEIMANLYLIQLRREDGYDFWLQNTDEKTDFTLTVDFSKSQNFKLKPGSNFKPEGSELVVKGTVGFQTERLDLGTLELADEEAEGAKMSYALKASKSTSRWESLQKEKAAAEAAAKTKAEEEEAARKAAEEEARKKAEEEARKKAEAEAAKKAADEEAARKKKADEEEAARKKKEAEDEAARKKAEEAARKKAAEEEAARKKKAEEEEAARKKKEAEEAERKKAEEAARKKKEAEEAEKKRLEEEEKARKAAEEAERKKKEAELAAKRAKIEEDAKAREKKRGKPHPACVRVRPLASHLGTSLDEAMRHIRSGEYGPMNWALLEYEAPLKLIEAGSQGLFEMFDFMSDDIVCCGLVRIAFGSGDFRRCKYITFDWIGDNSSAMKRAKAKEKRDAVMKAIGAGNADITIMGAKERTPEWIINKVMTNFVIDGAAKPSCDLYEKTLEEDNKRNSFFYGEPDVFKK